MRIAVRRSGGFAGAIEDLGSLDTAMADEARRQQIEDIVQAVDFFHLPSDIPDASASADRFRFEITVSDDSAQHSVSFQDTDSPSPVTEQLLRLRDAVTG
jgi:hypothetical protein